MLSWFSSLKNRAVPWLAKDSCKRGLKRVYTDPSFVAARYVCLTASTPPILARSSRTAIIAFPRRGSLFMFWGSYGHTDLDRRNLEVFTGGLGFMSFPGSHLFRITQCAWLPSDITDSFCLGWNVMIWKMFKRQQTKKLPHYIILKFVFVFYFYWLHPIDNTLAVQYQLIQSCLNYVYNNSNNKRRKLEWRRAHYSKTNHGPLTRLTLFYCSFVIH